MSLTKIEKLVLFNQLRDIRKGLKQLLVEKGYTYPLRLGGDIELDKLIKKSEK